MCIAIFQPSDKPKVSKDRLRICDINNPHGAGFAYAKDGKLIIEKGFFDFEAFYAAYQLIPENCSTIVHFRIATSGNKDEENCHPWKINDDVCIAHNGVIPDFADSKSNLSDTGNFVEYWLKPVFEKLGNKAYNLPYIRYAIFKILAGDKAIILNSDGSFYIFNDDDGVYEDGIWYSNKSYVSLKGAKVEKKEQVSKVFVNCHNQRRFGYIKVGSTSMLPLHEKEINALLKEHHCKLKRLVKSNVIQKIQLGPNNELDIPSEYGEGQEGLEKWLARNAQYHN